jgi:hypothetical protein
MLRQDAIFYTTKHFFLDKSYFGRHSDVVEGVSVL